MKPFALLLASLAALASTSGLAAAPTPNPRDPAQAEEGNADDARVPPVDRSHEGDRKDLLHADPNKRMAGISVEAGGGVGGFIDNRISSVTSAQGQWTARMIFGTRSHFGGEAAYVGSAQGVNTVGISPNATLLGNGTEGAFRLNVLTGMFQPYAIAGLGWMHYSLGPATLTTSDVQQNGDVVTFPLGLGMAWRMDGLVLDSRLSFHPATTSALIRDTNLSTWDLQARAGFEF
jgi:hypothetical protein